jgi:hypothetical protein
MHDYQANGRHGAKKGSLLQVFFDWHGLLWSLHDGHSVSLN